MNSELTVKEPTRYDLFVIVSLTGIISFFAYALLAGANAFDWLVMNNNNNWQFGDYFQHLVFMQNAKYVYAIVTGRWGTFPPLVYMFYYLIHLLTARDGHVVTYMIEYQLSDYTLLVFLFYSIFITLAFLYAVKLWNDRGRYKLLFTCLLLSTPFFAGVYERGNSCLIVIILLLIALKWKDSDSKVIREFALFLIAISAGIKIYPAIFGLLYLKEKRWREALRLSLYGVVLFFGPFLFFLGRDGFLLWLLNIKDTFEEDCIGRVQFIKGVVSTAVFLATGETPDETIGSAASIFFLLIMIFLAFLSNSRSRTVFFLCAAMTFFPSNAFRYTLCYLAIPLIVELAEHGDERLKKSFPTIESLFYGLIFTIPTYWGAFTLFRLNYSDNYSRATCVEVWIYLMAYLLLIIMIIHELFAVLKNNDFNQSFKKLVKE